MKYKFENIECVLKIYTDKELHDKAYRSNRIIELEHALLAKIKEIENEKKVKFVCFVKPYTYGFKKHVNDLEKNVEFVAAQVMWEAL